MAQVIFDASARDEPSAATLDGQNAPLIDEAVNVTDTIVEHPRDLPWLEQFLTQALPFLQGELSYRSHPMKRTLGFYKTGGP